MKHTPRKRFGQNFLHDPAIIERLVAIIAPAEGQRFIEVGPGKGALTLPLLERGVHVHAIEIDRDLAAGWQQFAVSRANFALTCGDALRIDYAKLLGDAASVRLVGNLPYNISTPLLFRFVSFAPRIYDAHFMLQKEVVDRMCADPGSKTYGRLTVMLAPHFTCERMLRVAAGAFSPAPKVESAFVRLRPHREPPFALVSDRAYAAVVAAAFSMRRKTIRNSLRSLLDSGAIAELGLDPGARAETLSPSDFARLAERAAHGHEELR